MDGQEVAGRLLAGTSVQPCYGKPHRPRCHACPPPPPPAFFPSYCLVSLPPTPLSRVSIRFERGGPCWFSWGKRWIPSETVHMGWEGPRPPWKWSTTVFGMQDGASCLSCTYSCLWALHFTYFISSVVSIFRVDTLKLREGKRVFLVTQLPDGRVGIELGILSCSSRVFSLQHPCHPGLWAHWC